MVPGTGRACTEGDSAGTHRIKKKKNNSKKLFLLLPPPGTVTLLEQCFLKSDFWMTGVRHLGAHLQSLPWPSPTVWGRVLSISILTSSWMIPVYTNTGN